MPPKRRGGKATRGNSTPRGGGRGRGGGGRGGSRLDTSFVPFNGASSGGKGRGLTLQEEARNTERHSSFWNTDQRLRDTKVAFVSAGGLAPAIQDGENDDPDLAKMSLEDTLLQEEEEGLENGGTGMEDIEEWAPQFPESDIEEVDNLFVDTKGSKTIPTDLPPPEVRVNGEVEGVNNFFVDTAGSSSVSTGLPPPRIRSVSPTPSNSSEEVLLFAGRDRQGKGIVRTPQPSRAPSRSAHTKARTVVDSIQTQEAKPTPVESAHSQVIVIEEEEDSNEGSRRFRNSYSSRMRIVEDKIHEKEEQLENILRHDDPFQDAEEADGWTKAKGKGVSSKRSKKSGRKSRGSKMDWKTEDAMKTEDQLLADYIANMDPEELKDIEMGAFGTRELGGDDEDVWVETEVSSDYHKHQAGWTRSDVEDFDDLSTSDGIMGEVQEILSKRDRHRGVQYLVVWEDQATDEARWVPATTLITVQALALIESFEAEEKLVAEFQNAGDEDTSDSDEIDDDDEVDDSDDMDDIDGDQDSRDRAQAAMSDEKIARLLAKQESYGMGSDELLLFDNNGDDIEADEEAFLRTSLQNFMSAEKRKKPFKGPNRAKGDFPSATRMADAYDNFDVMDFDRPSLKPKSKGRKGKLTLDLSDSELEASMEMAWTNDRMKKADRKKQREELRAQGLLSKNGKKGKPDLNFKYKEGMGINDVKEEIRAFLRNDHTTLALPPMTSADRKTVHELCLNCNLKSKSVGKGNTRAPILTKTQRSTPMSDAIFDTHFARLTRRFMPRPDVSGKRMPRTRGFGGGGRGGGFNNAAVGYRDGDIVGGSAPELGVENKGRAMLEKMGWSSGTALGALGNKGIMLPVAHVVKNTRAGLG